MDDTGSKLNRGEENKELRRKENHEYLTTIFRYRRRNQCRRNIKD